MANNGTVITAPVVMPTDIAAVLHISGTDLEANCKSSVINPWAKYKPVRYPYIDNTKDPSSGTSWLNSDKTWNSLANWWKYRQNIPSDLRSCGFHIPTSDVSSLASGDLAGWEYEKPQGGASQPYRLTDFNQYYHGAVAPFVIDIPARIIKDGSVTRGRVQARILDHPTINDLGLTLFDIFDTSLKLGIAVVNNGAVYTKTQASTSDNVISLEGLQNYVSVGDTVKIIAFATRTTKTSWSIDDYTLYSLNAPNIGFDTSANVPVIATLQTAYQIAVAGITGTDRNVLRPGTATYNSGSNRVVATNNSSANPTNTWAISTVKCEVYRCSADGTRELYDTRTYTQSTANAEPSYIAHNEGPYSQLYCTNVYPVSTLPTLDPTQYYWQIRYTFQYEASR